MKHRSRLLTIAVAPILFSRSARHFFQNDSTLRTNNPLCLVRIFFIVIKISNSQNIHTFILPRIYIYLSLISMRDVYVFRMLPQW